MGHARGDAVYSNFSFTCTNYVEQYARMAQNAPTGMVVPASRGDDIMTLCERIANWFRSWVSVTRIVIDDMLCAIFDDLDI